MHLILFIYIIIDDKLTMFIEFTEFIRQIVSFQFTFRLTSKDFPIIINCQLMYQRNRCHRLTPKFLVLNSISTVYFCNRFCYCSCFCEVVDADTNSQIHNFGSIQSCSGFPTCACRRQEMITCGDKCDERVAEWLESNRAKCAGRFIKKYYKASTCGSPTYGHERRKC